MNCVDAAFREFEIRSWVMGRLRDMGAACCVLVVQDQELGGVFEIGVAEEQARGGDLVGLCDHEWLLCWRHCAILGVEVESLLELF